MVVDYYSRFIIAFPVANLTAKTVADIFFYHVICRMDGMRRIVGDNGKCFVGEEFRVLCEKYAITRFFTSVGHPKTGGLIEKANRTSSIF